MGLHEDLDEATRLATREMVEFLVADKGLSRDEAYVLCSLGGRSAGDAGRGPDEGRARDDREVYFQMRLRRTGYRRAGANGATTERRRGSART